MSKGNTHHRNSIIRVRVNPHIKRLATEHLKTLGLSVSEFVRLKLAEMAYLDSKLRPNGETLEAMKSLKAGEGTTCRNSDELFALIGIDE